MPSSVPFVLFLGALAALANVAGGALPLLRTRMPDRLLFYGLAFSGGFLFAVAFLHIIPECVRATTSAPLLFVIGYFLVHAAEHLFAGHAHHPSARPHGAHRLIGIPGCAGHAPIRASAAWSAVAGLTLHSFFDGAAIAAAVAARPDIGWMTFLAVALHKVPDGFSISTIALGGSGSRGKAFAAAIGMAAASLCGTVATLFAARAFAGIEGPVLSIAAGMFVHIAATDLLPTTSQVRGMRTMLATVAGAIAVAAVSGFLNLAP